jgi:hypothetical protein
MTPPAGLLATMFLRDDLEARNRTPIELSPLLVAVLAETFDDND